MRAAVVLLAAGSGERAGGKTPKQFLRLNGEPLFWKSVRVFAAEKSVQEIVVVAQAQYRKRIAARFRREKFSGKWTVVDGGSYRGASVRNGVKAIVTAPDIVMIHDVARPLLSSGIVRRVADAAMEHGAALAAWPLPDTLKQVAATGRVRATIPRQNLWTAQTPQAFRWDVAQACLLHPSPTATDDTELAERKGFAVHVVKGAATNFKVTYPSDLDVCRRLAR
jgi:2-C-methyl-D-erythritol 4-phosphate cytidylyltransferase